MTWWNMNHQLTAESIFCCLTATSQSSSKTAEIQVGSGVMRYIAYVTVEEL